MHELASKMELGDKETVAICIQASVTCYIARNTSLYAYGTYHTRMIIPYAYGIQNCTIRIWYIPYAYGMYHTHINMHMVQNINKCINIRKLVKILHKLWSI